MIVRNVGSILLALGFGTLAIAALLSDPVALDANIGAGVLTLVGMPVGTLGLMMIVVGLINEHWLRRRARHQESKHRTP